MIEAARAVIALSSRTSAGTLPLDSHRTGASRGPIRAWYLSGSGAAGLLSISRASNWKTYGMNSVTVC